MKQGRPQLNLKLVGADVEVFLMKGDKPVPCIGLFKGTKAKPEPILTHLGKGYALQEDNVMLEYNIPPADSSHAFVYSLMRIQEEIVARVGNYGLKPVIAPSMRFELSQLEHEQAKTFGCDPDYNVWERKINDPIDITPETENLRTAGGHVHIGFTVGDKEPGDGTEYLSEVEAVVMGMDIFVGVPATLLDKEGAERRKFYGKAGAFRPKPYGVEYRVLSDFWTRDPNYIGWLYQQVKAVFAQINHGGGDACQLFKQYKNVVTAAINEGDVNSANKIIRNFGIAMPA